MQKKAGRSQLTDDELRRASQEIKEKSHFRFDVNLVKKSLSDFNHDLVYPALTRNEKDKPSYEQVKERFEREEHVVFVENHSSEGAYMQIVKNPQDRYGLSHQVITRSETALARRFRDWHYFYWDAIANKYEKVEFIASYTRDPTKLRAQKSVFIKTYETDKLFQTFAGYRASHADAIDCEESTHMLERFKQLTRAVVGCEKVGLSEDDVPTYKSTFDGTMWYSVEEEYFTRLLAFVFQKPGSLPGVDVLIVDPSNEFGTGGTGKDTHGLVLRAMAGKEYCISCKPEQVFGCRFPVDFTQCKFMFYSEGKITEQQAEDHKNHTTEEECTIERKYEGADKNAQHFELQIQYSNETRKARHFDNGTRRSFVAKASSTLKRTVGWFDDFYGGRSRPYRFEKPHVVKACYDYLMGINVDGFYVGGDAIPKNDIFIEMASHSLAPEQEFWNHLMDEVPSEWLNRDVSVADIVSKFKHYFPHATLESGNSKVSVSDEKLTDNMIMSSICKHLNKHSFLFDHTHASKQAPKGCKLAKKLPPGACIMKHKQGTVWYRFAFNRLALKYHKLNMRLDPKWHLDVPEGEKTPSEIVEDWYDT